MYVLAFGEKKIEVFSEGDDPPWPPRKNVVSQKKNQKNIFALDPNFIILKYCTKEAVCKKTEFKRLKIDQVMDI